MVQSIPGVYSDMDDDRPWLPCHGDRISHTWTQVETNKAAREKSQT